MWVFLKNGRSFWIEEGKAFDEDETGFHVYGPRKVWLATFKSDAIAGYYYDNTAVTTYGIDDKTTVESRV